MTRHYYSLNEYYHQKYGSKVYKLSLSAGLSCPNRDGTVARGGCSFCSGDGSGAFAAQAAHSIPEQLAEAKARVQQKNAGGRFVAYFQPFSNTYGEIAYLRKIYQEAIAPDDVVGLNIATRPDCLPDEVLALLKEINGIKPVTVELGLQTIHQRTAEDIRRGYPLSVYDSAVQHLHEIGVEVVTHLILGLPHETPEMMLDSVRYAGRVSDGVKLQLLHILEGTDLAADYLAGRCRTLSLEEYTDVLCRAIEVLDPQVVVHRITGDGDKRQLIAPLWSADKKRVLNYINCTMDERGIIQGSKA